LTESRRQTIRPLRAGLQAGVYVEHLFGDGGTLSVVRRGRPDGQVPVRATALRPSPARPAGYDGDR